MTHAPGSPTNPAAPPRQDAPQALLARLTRPDDDEYAAAAASRRTSGDETQQSARPGRSSLLVFGAAVAALAVLVTVAALQTQESAPQDERDREALLLGIRSEQAGIARVSAQAEQLAAQVEALQTGSVTTSEQVAALQAQLRDLRVVAGGSQVSGPGVVVTVDDAASGAVEGIILDTDLRLLVNGLWQAGAEAIAVNGERLTTLSAIRTAGEAITVNYRSLSPPYVLSAIGDPGTLPARLLETEAGQTFTDLRINFGVTFEVETREELVLPAATLGVRRASAVGPPDGLDGPSGPAGGVS